MKLMHWPFSQHESFSRMMHAVIFALIAKRRRRKHEKNCISAVIVYAGSYRQFHIIRFSSDATSNFCLRHISSSRWAKLSSYPFLYNKISRSFRKFEEIKNRANHNFVYTRIFLTVSTFLFLAGRHTILIIGRFVAGTS